jgi:hypothetical protein
VVMALASPCIRCATEFSHKYEAGSLNYGHG